MDKKYRVKHMYLTPNQRKVFRYFMSGLSNSEIAQKTGIELSNVIAYVKNSVDRVCQFYYNIATYEKCLKGNVLSRTEKRILRLWKIDGKTDAYICAKRKITRSTLTGHKTHIGMKIGISGIERAGKDYSIFNDPPEYSTPDIGNKLIQEQTAPKS